MKTIKILFLLIILGLISTLVYQNLNYFMTPSALQFNLKVSTWNWTTPELPNIVYWGICLGLGLLVTGMKGLFTAFGLGREIKAKNVQIDSLEQKIKDLNTRLSVFVHDPYMKKVTETNSVETVDSVETIEPEAAVGDTKDAIDLHKKGDSEKSSE